MPVVSCLRKSCLRDSHFSNRFIGLFILPSKKLKKQVYRIIFSYGMVVPCEVDTCI